MTVSPSPASTGQTGFHAWCELLEVSARHDAPLGLDTITGNGRLFLTASSLAPELGAASPVTALLPDWITPRVLDLLGRTRWVAADLAASSAMLAKVRIELRRGLCLRMAEQALDAFEGVAASMATEHTVAERYAKVMRRIANAERIRPVGRLIELDSIAAMVAGGFNALGVPWDQQAYRQVMARALLEPRVDDSYPRLTQLDGQISKLLGGARFDWTRELPEAFEGEGVELATSAVAELATVDHPAVPLILRWRELEPLAARHGYDWAAEWVHDDRWLPQFRPVATASGRWTGAGGALQLPHCLRGCVVAPPGRMLISADLAQLEPRMWAQLSGDPFLVAACAQGDVYAELGHRLRMPRAEAKRAFLAALYDDGSARSRPVAELLRGLFPDAMRYLARAAALGRRGAVVRTGLGRTSPPPDGLVVEAMELLRERRGAEHRQALARRGRQIRNFLIQGNAAELAGAVLAGLRDELRRRDARLVLFCHDEFLIDAARAEVTEIKELLPELVNAAAARVLGESRVQWPLTVGHGRTWAEAGKK